MNESEEKWWSIERTNASLCEKLDELKIDDFQVVSRGKLLNDKYSKKNAVHKPSKTQDFLIPFPRNEQFNRDSGYYSSMSPQPESSLDITQVPSSSTSSSTEPTISQSSKIAIRNELIKKIKKKKQTQLDSDFIFQFGETKLIKVCRVGNISEVEEAINELLRNNKLKLIDHQNHAKETALSVAIYHRDENLINLLIKYNASPTVLLTMGNNVLHLAAAMGNDPQRMVLQYLIKYIKFYQPNQLMAVITDRNLFNSDVGDVLKAHKQLLSKTCTEFQCLELRINEIQLMVNAFFFF